MEKWKIILRKIFFLRPLPTVLIAVPSFALVTLVLVQGRTDEPISYVAYGLAAYALVITVTGIAGVGAAFKKWFWNFLPVKAFVNSKIGQKFIGSLAFRSAVFLHQGLFINLLYAGFKMVCGILYHSAWLVAFGIYYLLLSAMRGALVFYIHSAAAKGKEIGQDIIREFRFYRICGVMLLFMNQALAGIVIYIVHKNQGMEYPGLLIYVMAMYAFYAVILASVNIVRFRKEGSPLLSAIQVTSLTGALVSMLSLETAMISRFGAGEVEFRRIMTSISGAVICTFVLALAIYMIARSTRYLKQAAGGEQILSK